MRAFLSFLLVSGAAFAADLTGVWVGQIPVGRNGDLQDIAFKLTQTGSSIGGKLYGDYKSSLIREGSVEGDQIVFIVLVEEQAGNQINESRYKYTGSLKDGELELTREREAAVTAGSGAGVQPPKNANKPTFRLKRLY